MGKARFFETLALACAVFGAAVAVFLFISALVIDQEAPARPPCGVEIPVGDFK